MPPFHLHKGTLCVSNSRPLLLSPVLLDLWYRSFKPCHCMGANVAVFDAQD